MTAPARARPYRAVLVSVVIASGPVETRVPPPPRSPSGPEPPRRRLPPLIAPLLVSVVIPPAFRDARAARAAS